MKKRERKLILSKETISQLVPRELGKIMGRGLGCTSPYFTAFDCSGGTWTGQSDSHGASVYCTAVQM
jgi:hypothetical protein